MDENDIPVPEEGGVGVSRTSSPSGMSISSLFAGDTGTDAAPSPRLADLEVRGDDIGDVLVLFGAVARSDPDPGPCPCPGNPGTSTGTGTGTGTGTP